MPARSTPFGGRLVASPRSYLPPATRGVIGLRPNACRWPLGDIAAEDFAFCAVPCVGRGSYCARHKALSCKESRT